MSNHPTFDVYKGLQRPLMFKGFKGKFIYIGAGCVVGSLAACAIISTVISFMYGAFSLLIILFGGLLWTSQAQQKGLHKKSIKKGVYIVSKTFSKDAK